MPRIWKQTETNETNCISVWQQTQKKELFQLVLEWHPTAVLLPGKPHGWRSLVGCSPWGHEESDTTEQPHFHFHFHFRALEKEMATHCSVLAWRIPGTGKPGGLLSMGSHTVGHDWTWQQQQQPTILSIQSFIQYILRTKILKRQTNLKIPNVVCSFIVNSNKYIILKLTCIYF